MVTVVFCDVVGSTALGESTDPETLRALLARYFERMRGIVVRHGGSVEKFIGDAVMAVFGVPVVHEDDALRALRAAAEMRAALPELGVQGRIGVATGEVVTGTEERLATGDAVNVAARLQQAAAPGEILVGSETRALGRDAIAVEALAPLELKGKHAPVAAFRLLSVEPDAPGLARRLDAPMVGRRHERRALEDAFQGAVRGRTCALFTLLGTAGVGKSRLVREFLARVDATVLEGRCLSYGEGITYWPVVEIVKQLGAEPEGPVAALLGDSAIPTSPEEIAWAVRKLLERAAAERPLVVVLDDLHWGEATLLDLVEHVADLSRDAPILLLCLARPELLDRRPGWGGGKLHATTVLLEPLDAVETDELIERLLGGEELEPGLSARIRAAAEGNPLFVEEMLAMVRESGEHEVAVPPTIKALLAARLDQLDPAERGVLERGSVEGQLFHSAAVVAIAREPASVDRQLVALVRKELVRPERSQLPESDAYRFRHLLIRDAAYDALPKSARAELHERFARWLEEHGGSLVERDEIVGYHLEQAHRYRAELGPVDAAGEAVAAEAAGLLAAAGRAARLRGDFRAAGSLFGRAADLGTPARAALLPELAEMLLEVGGFDGALEHLDEAVAAGDETTSAVAAAWRSAIGGHVGDPSASFAATIERARAAAALAEAAGDEGTAASMLVLEGQHRFFAGRSREAETVLGEALERALEAGDLFRARQCIIWLFAAKSFGAAPVSEMRSMLDEVPEQLVPSLELTPLHHMHPALTAAYAGRFEEAREHCCVAGRLAEEVGWLVHGAGMTMFTGDIELLAAEPEKAERVLRGGFDKLEALGETGFRSTVGTLLAEALVRLGRDDEALEALDVAEAIAQADDCDPQVRLRAVRAVVLARRGELAEAERLSREALDLARTTDYLMLHGDAASMRAEVLLAAGDEEGAAAALREALEQYEQKENAPEAERTQARLAAAARA